MEPDQISVGRAYVGKMDRYFRRVERIDGDMVTFARTYWTPRGVAECTESLDAMARWALRETTPEEDRLVDMAIGPWKPEEPPPKESDPP